MQEIKLESLDDGPGILPFKLGPCHIISHYHAFLQYINLQELEDHLNTVTDQLNEFSPSLNNKTFLFQPHVDYLKHKLHTVLKQLQSFELNRSKRGLIDGLGSVVKSITGNLDYTDAVHFNSAIDTLRNSNDKLVTEFNNHVSLTQDWITQHSNIIENVVNNQNKLGMLIRNISQTISDHDPVRYAHLAQTIFILSDNVDIIAQEITKLQNVLAFIRTSTTHHATISFDTIRSIIDKLSSIYGSDRILDLDIREYYDIVQLGSYYVKNEIVIVFKFPVVLPEIYDLYKISIVPNKHHEVLIPYSPLLAIHSKEFKYIEAECPKSTRGYLCEEIHNVFSRNSQDCIQDFITHQQRTPECNSTVVSLQKPAYEKLDDRHYTISFPEPLKTRLSCGQDLYKMVHGSYLVVIPHNCYLETHEFRLTNSKDRIKGQALKLIDIPTIKDNNPMTPPLFELNSINLDHFHEANRKISLQTPVQLSISPDSSLYHTTIPMYALVLGISALIGGLAYRRYHLKQLKPKMEKPKDTQIELQAIYSIPVARGIDPDNLPAQFTTSVSNNRCSSGGGVTQPLS